MKYLDKYGYMPVDEKIADRIKAVSDNLDGISTPEVLKECFALMDLTTLHTNDTEASVVKLVDKVAELREKYPELHVTTVSSCFPSAQSFLEVKVRECELAVENGADEVDIVLALNAFLAGDEDRAFNEIASMRAIVDAKAAEAGRKVVLKVILETGLLVSPRNIAEASFLAMEAGADFIKTSTGKVDVNATPTAAAIMCECIARYFEKTGRKVGFKAAGGISTSEDALSYYFIVSSILGKEWLNRDGFRLGVSRLGNSLMSSIEQKTVKFF